MHQPGHVIYWVKVCSICHEPDWDDLDRSIEEEFVRRRTVEQNFQTTARTMVMNYFNSHKDMTDEYVMTFSDTYVVWFCKTLQNWKALVSTNVPDGVYYEVTHNGEEDIGQTYLDVYKKIENIAMPDEALRIETSATGPDERDFVPESIPPRPPTMQRYETPNPLIKGEEKDPAWTAGSLKF